jgi:hypothetical protein
MHPKTLVENNLKGSDYFEDLGVDVSLLLKLILKKSCARVSVELVSQSLII